MQLDLSEGEGEGGVDNRSGTFVMYNCARLATLLQSFEQQVEQGGTSPLWLCVVLHNWPQFDNFEQQVEHGETSPL